MLEVTLQACDGTGGRLGEPGSEVSLVENQWFHHGNFELFRPGLSRGNLRAATAVAKEDIEERTKNASSTPVSHETNRCSPH